MLQEIQVVYSRVQVILLKLLLFIIYLDNPLIKYALFINKS